MLYSDDHDIVHRLAARWRDRRGRELDQPAATRQAVLFRRPHGLLRARLLVQPEICPENRLGTRGGLNHEAEPVLRSEVYHQAWPEFCIETEIESQGAQRHRFVEIGVLACRHDEDLAQLVAFRVEPHFDGEMGNDRFAEFPKRLDELHQRVENSLGEAGENTGGRACLPGKPPRRSGQHLA
ncbi:hypothetical protein [Agrobacterium tumefaciens]|uniref:hypothetical protein n=1 Tax=Agrobacterium tumefaciens TaxID=358 RepID=UPI001573E6BF|nr:hypothetical protein [Agrobacterium tumefaciens]